MPCSMPWCDVDEPHHHLTYLMGPSFSWQIPPAGRRRHGVKAGWPEEKIARFVANPYTPEFMGTPGPTLDELLPMDKFWEWIARLKVDPTARPFIIPPDYGQPAEPEGEDPACE